MRARLFTATFALALTAGLTGCGGGGGYDEAAHRAALESQLGHPVADWPTIVRVTKDVCASDYLDLTVAAAMDRGNFETLATNISYVCPDRSAEVTRVHTGLL